MFAHQEARVATVALTNVSKVFGDGTIAVDDVSLDVADGEFMALLGPSGAASPRSCA
jgi:multiple sugar transport system ATP-binding protein